jgi:hypothetical protein
MSVNNDDYNCPARIVVIDHERVARAQLGTEHPLKIGPEHLGIDWAFDQEGSFDAFMAQGRNESGALPVAVRDGAETTLAQRAAAIVAGQLGVQAGFINKNQPADIPVGLVPAPKPPGGFNVGPILLGGARRFFYSSDRVVPGGATKRWCQWKLSGVPNTVFGVRLRSGQPAPQSIGAEFDHAFPSGSAGNPQSVWAGTRRSDGAASKSAPRFCD